MSFFTTAMDDFLIIGSDAAVGKTYVACGLLRSWRGQGRRALGMKPICCGDRADARALREAAGEPTLSLDLLNPCYLRTKADPLIAARLERKSVELPRLVAAYRQLKDMGYGPVLVEGASWETPLAPGCSMADLAAELGLPVLLVVANRQGAASLAVMAARGIAARGLRCKGIILNKADEEWDSAAVTNRQLIEEVTGLPVLAELICGEVADAACLT